MSILKDILKANKIFCQRSQFSYVQEGEDAKVPQRHFAIVTCMDTRLVNFLEPALGIQRGECTLIKSAGNYITDSFDNIIQSLLVSIFELGVTEIFVIGHQECGMTNTTSDKIIGTMIQRGISMEAIKLFCSKIETWANGFKDPESNVYNTVKKLKEHPLIPADIVIHGLMFHPRSGKLEEVL